MGAPQPRPSSPQWDEGSETIGSPLAPHDGLEEGRLVIQTQGGQKEEGGGERSRQGPSAKHLLRELVHDPLASAPALQHPCPPPPRSTRPQALQAHRASIRLRTHQTVVLEDIVLGKRIKISVKGKGEEER